MEQQNDGIFGIKVQGIMSVVVMHLLPATGSRGVRAAVLRAEDGLR